MLIGVAQRAKVLKAAAAGVALVAVFAVSAGTAYAALVHSGTDHQQSTWGCLKADNWIQDTASSHHFQGKTRKRTNNAAPSTTCSATEVDGIAGSIGLRYNVWREGALCGYTNWYDNGVTNDEKFDTTWLTSSWPEGNCGGSGDYQLKTEHIVFYTWPNNNYLAFTVGPSKYWSY